MTTTRTERIARLRAVSADVSQETYDLLSEQSKKAAANMLLTYGDKTCLSATGFIYCVDSAHEAALLYLLAEGVVTLNPEHTASPEERAERAAREQKQDPQVLELTSNRAGAYI